MMMELEVPLKIFNFAHTAESLSACNYSYLYVRFFCCAFVVLMRLIYIFQY